MTARSDWLELNNAFLSAALTWLRLRLAELAAQRAEHAPRSLEIDQAAELMQAAAQIDPPPALLNLSRQLGLSPFEQDTLLLCAALELDTRLPALCAQAQGDVTRPYPTFALALALFDEPRWDVLSPERPLRHWRLIEIGLNAAQPLIASPLRIDERIANYLKGLNALDERLTALLSDIANDAADLSATQRGLADEIVQQVQHAARQSHAAQQSRAVVVQLLGADSISKQLIARAVAELLHLPVRRLPVPWLPTAPGELAIFTRLWQRENQLLPAALYLDAREIDRASGITLALQQFLDQARGVCFIDTPEALPALDRVTLIFDITKPTSDEQLAAWSALNLNGSAPRLTAQFDLNLAAIRDIAQTSAQPSTAFRSAQDASLNDAIWSACLTHTRPQDWMRWRNASRRRPRGTIWFCRPMNWRCCSTSLRKCGSGSRSIRRGASRAA